MQVKQYASREQQHSNQAVAPKVPKSHIPNSAMLAMMDAPIQPEELSALPGSEHQPTDALRDEIQARLGVSMPGLRIFEDKGLKEEYNQQAYARGNEIHVAQGEYAPHTRSGLDLLMHEATHIVQQGSGMARGSGILMNSAMESQADTGMTAPAHFVMPTSAAGSPIQGKGIFSRMAKKHRQAVDQFNEHEEDYRQMSGFQRFWWSLKNPLARLRASSKKDDSDRRAGRTDAYQAAEADLRMDHPVVPDAEYTDPQGAIQQNKQGGPAWTQKGWVKLSALAGPLGSAAMDKKTVSAEGGLRSALTGTLPSAVTDKDRIIGGSSGLLTTVTSGIGAAANIANASADAKKGKVSDSVSSGFNAAANVLTGLGGAAKMAAYGIGSAGAISAVTGGIIPGLGIISGGAQAISGGIRTDAARRHRHNLKKDIANLDQHNELIRHVNDPDSEETQAAIQKNVTLAKAAKQARSMDQTRLVEGSMDMITGGLLTVGSGATLLGAAPIGLIAKLTAFGAGIGKGIVSKKMTKHKKKNVVEEELGLKEKMASLKRSGAAKSDSEAKHLALRAMGFASGKRKEAFANITMQRAATLHKAAAEGDNNAQQIIKHMGVHQTGGTYSLQAIAEKMGMSSASSWQDQLKAVTPEDGGRTSNPFAKKVRKPAP